MLPLFPTMKLVLVDEPMTNCGAPERSPFGFTDKSPHGVVEAMPTKPPVVAKKELPVEVNAVVDA